MGKTVKDIKNIDVEIKKFEDKLNQFQTYLQNNTIISQVTKEDRILLSEENQELLHKEITMQIKMQDAILAWLPLLKKLKEDEAVKIQEMRGGAEANGLFLSENNKK
jgi:peroxiredoxin family protein